MIPASPELRCQDLPSFKCQHSQLEWGWRRPTNQSNSLVHNLHHSHKSLCEDPAVWVTQWNRKSENTLSYNSWIFTEEYEVTHHQITQVIRERMSWTQETDSASKSSPGLLSQQRNLFHFRNQWQNYSRKGISPQLHKPAMALSC